MNYTLELVLIPVSDVDAAKEFYAEKMGFRLDGDHRGGDSFRMVQLTPPGSACSIGFGIGIGADQSAPGSVQGLHLVVPDIEAAQSELAGRGVDIGEIQHFDETGKPTPGPHPDRTDYGSFLFFSDPDGNSWAIQEIRGRGAA
ncbi:MAG TPA: VOC family protein [Mycobacteriales bacterium]|nr:VOC family protein [Mycobacteriales bacterium]